MTLTVSNVCVTDFGDLLCFKISGGNVYYCSGFINDSTGSDTIVWDSLGKQFTATGVGTMNVKSNNYFAVSCGGTSDNDLNFFWQTADDAHEYLAEGILNRSTHLIGTSQSNATSVTFLSTTTSLDIAYDRNYWCVLSQTNPSATYVLNTYRQTTPSSYGSLTYSGRSCGRLGMFNGMGLLYSKDSNSKPYLDLVTANGTVTQKAELQLSTCARADSNPQHCDIAF